ncbi:MAG TPA: enoyl-CoA hydratase/isomerase family protein [Acidimicrobiia bacterium]|nr:enoyl-CoA hydratase/isomerase family protein [Acidimicrobiia bacterium]
MLDLETHGDVRVLHWRDGENRFNGASIAAWHDALDDLEQIEGPLALVVTGEAKFFTNGLDLDWLSTSSDAGAFMGEVQRLFGRMLVFPAYTVAAINGHVFAAGAMLSCAFDHRIMRADRGYWCLPEVDLGLALTPGMTATVTAGLPAATAHEAMLTGRRYGGEDALRAGIAHAIAAEADVLPQAIAAAAAIAPKSRPVIAEHKQQLFGAAAAACSGA